jgi:hypothetical protein
VPAAAGLGTVGHNPPRAFPRPSYAKPVARRVICPDSALCLRSSLLRSPLPMPPTITWRHAARPGTHPRDRQPYRVRAIQSRRPPQSDWSVNSVRLPSGSVGLDIAIVDAARRRWSARARKRHLSRRLHGDVRVLAAAGLGASRSRHAASDHGSSPPPPVAHLSAAHITHFGYQRYKGRGNPFQCRASPARSEYWLAPYPMIPMTVATNELQHRHTTRRTQKLSDRSMLSL